MGFALPWRGDLDHDAAGGGGQTAPTLGGMGGGGGREGAALRCNRPWRACNVARLRPEMPLTTADAPDERAEGGRCGRSRGYGALTAAGAAERRRDRPAQWPGPAGAAARKPRQGQRGQPVAREELRATAGAAACCITGPPAGGPTPSRPQAAFSLPCAGPVLWGLLRITAELCADLLRA